MCRKHGGSTKHCAVRSGFFLIFFTKQKWLDRNQTQRVRPLTNTACLGIIKLKATSQDSQFNINV